MHYCEYIHITMEQALYPRGGWKPTKGGMATDQGGDGIMSRYLRKNNIYTLHIGIPPVRVCVCVCVCVRHLVFC